MGLYLGRTSLPTGLPWRYRINASTADAFTGLESLLRLCTTFMVSACWMINCRPAIYMAAWGGYGCGTHTQPGHDALGDAGRFDRRLVGS